MTTDLLASLGDRDGWTAAPGGNGWRNDALDVTVRQVTSSRFTVEHAGAIRELTSATGALCVVDQIAAKATA